MAFQNVVMGYWPHALGLLLAVLGGFFIYGQYDNWKVDGQKTTTAQIAAQQSQLQQALAEKVDPVTRKLLSSAGWNVYAAMSRVQGMQPDEQMALISAPGFGHLMPLLYGQSAMGADLERGDALDATLLVLGDLDDETKALVVEAADRFAAIGAGSTGTASAQAYVQAAELYRVAGTAEQRSKALEQVIARGDGPMKYAASVTVAGTQADGGDVQGAVTRLRAFENDPDRFVAQDSLAQCGTLLETAGRTPEALDIYTKFLEKYPDTRMAVEIRARMERLGATPTAPTAPTTPSTTP